MAISVTGITASGVIFGSSDSGPPLTPGPPAPTEFWAQYIRETLPGYRKSIFLDNADSIISVNRLIPNPQSWNTINQDIYGNVQNAFNVDFSSEPGFEYQNMMDSTSTNNIIYSAYYVGIDGVAYPVFTSYETAISANNWTFLVDNELNTSVIPLSTVFSIGNIYSILSTEPGIVLMKTDINGGGLIEWSLTFSSPTPEKSLDRTIVGNLGTGDVIIAGTLRHSVLGNQFGIYVARIDSTGTIVWQKEFAKPAPDAEIFISAITADYFDNIFISGSTYDDIIQHSFIFELSSAGNFIGGVRTLGNQTFSSSKYFGEKIYYTGSAEGDSTTEGFIATTDLNMGVLWSNSIVSPTRDVFMTSLDVKTGYYVAYGDSSNYSDGKREATLILRQHDNGEPFPFTIDNDSYVMTPDYLQMEQYEIVPTIDSDFITTPYALTRVDLNVQSTPNTPDIGIKSTNGPPDGPTYVPSFLDTFDGNPPSTNITQRLPNVGPNWTDYSNIPTIGGLDSSHERFVVFNEPQNGILTGTGGMKDGKRPIGMPVMIPVDNGFMRFGFSVDVATDFWEYETPILVQVYSGGVATANWGEPAINLRIGVDFGGTPVFYGYFAWGGQTFPINPAGWTPAAGREYTVEVLFFPDRIQCWLRDTTGGTVNNSILLGDKLVSTVPAAANYANFKFFQDPSFSNSDYSGSANAAGGALTYVQIGTFSGISP